MTQASQYNCLYHTHTGKVYACVLHEILKYAALKVRSGIGYSTVAVGHRFVGRPIDHTQAAVELAIKGCQRAGGDRQAERKKRELTSVAKLDVQISHQMTMADPFFFFVFPVFNLVFIFYCLLRGWRASTCVPVRDAGRSPLNRP